MRTQFLSKRLVLFIFCGFVASQAYGTETSKQPKPETAHQALESVLQACKDKTRAEECVVEALWSIADIIKDGALSPAEISRVVRLAIKLTNEASEDKVMEETYGYLLGPVFAYFLLANFDYDADGKLTLQEFNQELADKNISSLIADFNSAKDDVASKLPTGLLPNILKTTPKINTPAIKRKIKKPKQKMTVVKKRKKKLVLAKQDKENPLELVSWDADLRKGDFSRYYQIQYELRNKLGKSIKLVDGSISFHDLLDEQIFRIAITKDLRVAPDATAKNSGRYSITFTRDIRLGNLPKNDVRTKLHIRQLVLEDNTIIKYK